MVFVNIFTRKYYKKNCWSLSTRVNLEETLFGVSHIIRYPVLVFADIRNIITFTFLYKFAMTLHRNLSQLYLILLDSHFFKIRKSSATFPVMLFYVWSGR